jgi:hypothetical protein
MAELQLPANCIVAKTLEGRECELTALIGWHPEMEYYSRVLINGEELMYHPHIPNKDRIAPTLYGIAKVPDCYLKLLESMKPTQ